MCKDNFRGRSSGQCACIGDPPPFFLSAPSEDEVSKNTVEFQCNARPLDSFAPLVKCELMSYGSEKDSQKLQKARD